VVDSYLRQEKRRSSEDADQEEKRAKGEEKEGGPELRPKVISCITILAPASPDSPGGRGEGEAGDHPV
jgi:hypothetical protein